MTSDPLPLITLEGTFYRAVDPQYRDYALSGSRNPGRYSRADQPTLYLSSTPDGVEAAMIAHRDQHSAGLTLVEVSVQASGIFDLRDAESRAVAGLRLGDATAEWKQLVAAGIEPSSWRVRRELEERGAQGLVDPSRKAPGLWHLVLFRWNEPGAAQVQLLDPTVG
ncbi:RES family NAD+ phosphorylase [Nesterenkonia sp. MY13]|uniref:RES family NAD+ phosphorylase n=1 Tax=Nesterenkonia sedimenti TaxID=1463632 RepID=A0A7X8TH95_9MICC|nr:RES family NAD+ phosphorylase [Nesterenkonia sedimenti]NLS08506.1 RES family NAD+ phosphorylase [Nesterenkonia sedimenti]